MTRRLAVAATLMAVTSVALIRWSPWTVKTTVAASHSAPLRSADLTREMPLAFERNLGQADPHALYLARGRSGTVFLGEDGALLRLPGTDGTGAGRNQSRLAFRMRLVGAARHLETVGEERLPTQANYFIGNDPRSWLTHVPTFARVTVRNVYPGVDLTYYGSTTGNLEYDFNLAAGADATAIQVAFDGVDGIRETADGGLLLTVGGREVLQRRPVVFQGSAQGRRVLNASYVVRQPNFVAFRVQDRDSARPMVIDPSLVYSKYLGGTAGDTSRSTAVDGNGNVWVTGDIGSVGVQTTNQLKVNGQDTSGTYGDAFVAKFDPTGTALLFTYLGGSAFDSGAAVAVDDQGNAYVTGTTESHDFPTPNGVQTASSGGDHAFLAKINADGSQLVYSTYLGGSATSSGRAVAVGADRSAFVVGSTISGTFTTYPSNVLQSTQSGSGDAFVVRLNPFGTDFVYSTYLGGDNSAVGTGVAVDGLGNAFVTGYGTWNAFPGCTSRGTSRTDEDLFVAEINPAGTARLVSRCLGGTANDTASAITIDGDGLVYVTGSTSSSDFPTTGVLTPGSGASPGAGGDAFVTKLNLSLSSPVYSVLIGDSGADTAMAIALDGSKNVYVVGTTSSTSFPLVRELQSQIEPTGITGYRAGFLASLNAAGTALVYSTYLGGSTQGDTAEGVAFDASTGRVYVTGTTYSNSFPNAPPRDLSRRDADGFLIAVASADAPVLGSLSPQAGPPSGGTTVTLTGANFPTSFQVWFGDQQHQAASTTFVSTSSIRVVTPAHEAGPVDVTVAEVNGSGTVVRSSTLAGGFTYASPPTITAANPNTGSSIGGTEVTISGSGFQAGATVSFGARAASKVTVTSATSLTATTPSLPTGTVDIVVTNPDGQSGTLAGGFTYWAQKAPSGCDTGGAASLMSLLGVLAAWLRRSPRATGHKPR